MSWCPTCRLEYRGNDSSCVECGGALLAGSAPERRASYAVDEASMRIVATLPPADALAVSERLDEGGIQTALRRASDDGDTDPAGDAPFHVLVADRDAGRARSMLERRRRLREDPMHTRVLSATSVVLIVALMLSAFLVAARWFFSGSPLP